MNIYEDSFDEEWELMLNESEKKSKIPTQLDNIEAFDKAFCNSNEILNTESIGFIPLDEWKGKHMTYHQIVLDFFRKKNSSKLVGL